MLINDKEFIVYTDFATIQNVEKVKEKTKNNKDESFPDSLLTKEERESVNSINDFVNHIYKEKRREIEFQYLDHGATSDEAHKRAEEWEPSELEKKQFKLLGKKMLKQEIELGSVKGFTQKPLDQFLRAITHEPAYDFGSLTNSQKAILVDDFLLNTDIL